MSTDAPTNTTKLDSSNGAGKKRVSHPEVASVGLTDAQAKGLAIKVGKSDVIAFTS